ncbi:MAG: Arm DNA-binding domain-containing protein, partial [Pseudomonadota bacterium]
MPNLTDTMLRSAEPGKVLWDNALKGFGVRVGKTRKTFIVLIESGRRKSIGHYPDMTLAEARREAKRTLAEKTLGQVRPVHTAF